MFLLIIKMKLQHCIVVDVVTQLSFETKTNGGNGEKRKDKTGLRSGCKFNDSPRLFIPWGFIVPATSIKKESLSFLIETLSSTLCFIGFLENFPSVTS